MRDWADEGGLTLDLVKGTSHLSLGQEAVAAGFAQAMKPVQLIADDIVD